MHDKPRSFDLNPQDMASVDGSPHLLPLGFDRNSRTGPGRQHDLTLRRANKPALDLVGFLDIAAVIGFDPGEMIRAF